MVVKTCSLLLACLFFFSCTDKVQKKTMERNGIKNDKTISVQVQILHQQTFQKQLIANGLIKAAQKTELRFKSGNRINRILARNGQWVQQGTTLAVLDNVLLANQLQKAEIAFDKAKNKLNEEKILYGLNGSEDSIIREEVLRNLWIKSGYREAKNNLQNIQILYDQTILKAPFSGVVANLETRPGNYITPGDIFCLFIDQNNLEIHFSVLESELGFVKMGLEVKVVPFSDNGKEYMGHISEINPVVDENGLIKIKARLQNGDKALLDGMHAKVFVNQPMDSLIVVPKEALVLRSNREVVFTVEYGLAKWNYVNSLYENSTSFALKEGLKIGDTIIVSGNMNLSHDARVETTLMENTENKAITGQLPASN